MMLVAATILLLTLAPAFTGAETESINVGDITVMTFSDQIDLDRDDGGQFNINLHNNSSTPVVVKISKSDSTPINIKLDGVNIIGADETCSVRGQMVTDVTTDPMVYDVIIEISVINSDDTISTGDLHIYVNVTPEYYDGGYRCTFMGLFKLPAPLNTDFCAITLTILGWVIVSALISLISYAVIRLIFKSDEDDAKKEAMKMALGVFIISMLCSVQNILLVAGLSGKAITITGTISKFAILIVAATTVWNLYRIFVINVFHKVDEKTGGADVSLIPLMNFIGKIVIICAAVAYGLALLNISLVGIVTGAGLAGIAVSLGAKPALNELFSGLTLIFTKPFVINDVVQIDGGSDIDVKKIGILKTEFVTEYSNDVITVMNSKLATSAITNITKTGRNYRVSLDVLVSEDTDLELAKKLILECADREPNALKTGRDIEPPAVMVDVKSIKGQCKLTLVFYAKKYDDSWSDRGRLRENILKSFRENDISRPYICSTVNIIGGEKNE